MARSFWDRWSSRFCTYINIEWVVNAGALLLVFLVVLILFSFLSNFISSKLRDSGIGMLDRTLGVAFGGLRGAFIVCLAYFVVVLVLPEKDHPDWIRDAKMRHSANRHSGYGNPCANGSPATQHHQH